MHGSTHVGSWTAREIHQAVLTAFHLSDAAYGLNQLRYDLRKLKGHGLLERDGSRYAFEGCSGRTAVLFFHKRLCGPLCQQPLPPSSRSAASTRKPSRSRVPPRRQRHPESCRPAGRSLRPPSPSKIADIRQHLAVMQPIPIRSINPSTPTCKFSPSCWLHASYRAYVVLTSCPPLDLTPVSSPLARHSLHAGEDHNFQAIISHCATMATPGHAHNQVLLHTVSNWPNAKSRPGAESNNARV